MRKKSELIPLLFHSDRVSSKNKSGNNIWCRLTITGKM